VSDEADYAGEYRQSVIVEHCVVRRTLDKLIVETTTVHRYGYKSTVLVVSSGHVKPTFGSEDSESRKLQDRFRSNSAPDEEFDLFVENGKKQVAAYLLGRHSLQQMSSVSVCQCLLSKHQREIIRSEIIEPAKANLAKYETATRRSRKLFRSFLTPRQRNDWLRTGSFYVISSNGYRYEICCKTTTTQNVYRVDDEHRRVEMLCAMVADSFLPKYDGFLTQKFALETDERGFRKTAKKWTTVGEWEDRRPHSSISPAYMPVYVDGVRIVRGRKLPSIRVATPAALPRRVRPSAVLTRGTLTV